MPKRFNDLPVPVQVAIFFLVAAVLAGTIFYVYVFPLKATRDGLQKEVNVLKEENVRNRVFELDRRKYLIQIAQLEKQLDTLRSIVPDEQATDDFMRMVFEGGRASQVNIRTFVPQALVTRDVYTEMPVNLRMDGTYYGLLSFFSLLAHEKRIISVSGLSLGPPQGGGMGAFKIRAGETVGANCVLTTYYNRYQTAPPPAPIGKK